MNMGLQSHHENPANKKKKKCQSKADSADTVRIGKRWYKECMDK